VDFSYLAIGNKTLIALSSCSKLEFFTAFGFYDFTPDIFKSFLTACKELKSLQMMHKGSYNNFKPINDLAYFLPLEKSPITKLDLKKISFTSSDSDKVLIQIIDNSRETLKSVDFSFVRCVSDQTVLALSKCPNLRKISLRGCVQNTHEFSINELVTNCKLLVNVNFSHLQITDLTIQLLLMDKSTIQTLEIDGCATLTPKCISLISARKSLKALSISLPWMNPDITIELARSLQNLLFLQINDISPNKLPKKPKPGDDQSIEKESYTQLVQELCDLLPFTVIRIG